MLTTVDILSIIEEQRIYDIKQLAKELELSLKQMEEILKDLSKHNLIEYNPKSGKVRLPSWLAHINEEIESIKPTTGEVILPKNQEIKIQDVIIGNFTKNDLELKIRLKDKLKEIAICDIG